jgi:hypothetical protein
VTGGWPASLLNATYCVSQTLTGRSPEATPVRVNDYPVELATTSTGPGEVLPSCWSAIFATCLWWIIRQALGMLSIRNLLE